MSDEEKCNLCRMAGYIIERGDEMDSNSYMLEHNRFERSLILIMRRIVAREEKKPGRKKIVPLPKPPGRTA